MYHRIPSNHPKVCDKVIHFHLTYFYLWLVDYLRICRMKFVVGCYMNYKFAGVR
jgi:hypothetical protein